MSATHTITTSPASVRIFSPFKGQYEDFRDELVSQGYAVVKGAVPLERASYYQQKAFEWLRSFDTSLDFEDLSTWRKAQLPVQTDKNTYENYGVVHERFMWEARMEPGVLDAFSKIWGTDELLASFDSLNITLLNLKIARVPWPYGIINLSHAGPEDGSLVVIPGSHTLVEEFFDTKTDPASWEWRDNRYFNDKDMDWFRGHGLEPRRVIAEPGDLILWDSRTIHWGGEPTEKSHTIRTVIYAAYAPATLATKEAITEKQKIFDANGATTHWPHDNIKLRDLKAQLPDGTTDPRDRSEPLEKAKQSEKLLKLAGVKAY
ncbi:hypothetical protein GGI43DRAFT_419603 [Trichoderma evansii]